MAGYSRLSFSRQVQSTEEVHRFTAKVNHFAHEIFGHDGASLTRDTDYLKSVGNPRYKLLKPLELSHIWRQGEVDQRNRASSSRRAEEKIARSTEFSQEMKALQNRYEGLDFTKLPVSFGSVALGHKPGYENGEIQVVLTPNLGEPELRYLVEESQLCSRALATTKIGQFEGPGIPSVPLLRLDPDVTTNELADFTKHLTEGVLPVTFILGSLVLESQDKASVTP